MIIECLGVPGSGKSAIVEELTKYPEVSTVPMYPSRMWSLLFTVLHPLYVAQWMKALISETYRTQTWSLFRFKLAVFVDTIGRVQLATRLSRERLVVLDEGLTQRLLSLFETHLSDDQALSWVKRIPVRGMVLVVEQSDGAKRRKLGTWRKTLGEEYGERWLVTVLDNQRAIQNALSARKDILNASYTYVPGESVAPLLERLSGALR